MLRHGCLNAPPPSETDPAQAPAGVSSPFSAWAEHTTSMTNRYKNPPIEEAICEFHFAPGQEWNLTVPGKFHSKITDEYDGSPREMRVFKTTLTPASDGNAPEIQHQEDFGRLMLVNSGGTRMVGIGRDVMSVHMLRPYQNPSTPKTIGWDEFQHRIKNALDTYWQVATPEGTLRINVRYINKLIIPKQTKSIKSYLKRFLECIPPDIPNFSGKMSNLTSRFEYNCPGGVKLALSQHLVDAGDEQLAFLLDIDVFWNTADGSLGQDAALEKTNQLKEQENKIFEALIKDKARENFNAD